MSKVQALLASLGGKKFVAAILGVLAVVLTTRFGLSEAQVATVTQWVGTIVSAFLVGQGVSEGLSGGKTSASAQAVEASKDAG